MKGARGLAEGGPRSVRHECRFVWCGHGHGFGGDGSGNDGESVQWTAGCGNPHLSLLNPTCPPMSPLKVYKSECPPSPPPRRRKKCTEAHDAQLPPHTPLKFQIEH